MGHSKNDIPFEGGFARISIKKISDKQNATFMLINPATRKPYINQEIIRDLQIRKSQYPMLTPQIDLQIKWLQNRVEKKSKPECKFHIMRSGESKDKAKKRLEEECYLRLRDLARLLFRPIWDARFHNGQVTIGQYAEYMKVYLFASASPDTRRHMLSCLSHIIIPAIGKELLCNISADKTKTFLRKINRKLNASGAKESQRGYVKRTYQAFFEQITQDGYQYASSLAALSKLIDTSKKQNRAITKAFKPSHLDDEQRYRLFSILSKPENLFLLFLIALYYSGLDFCEMAAMRFGDIEELHTVNGYCDCILVDKMVRKLDKRYSTLSATNDSFPIRRFRKVVLYPWAADILHRHVQNLQSQGFTMAQIELMRLSDTKPGCPIFGPTEIENAILPLLPQAGIDSAILPRTDTQGTVTQQKIMLDCHILWEDAQYVAKNYCGASDVMLHAMFGQAWTETDEHAYLDLLSDEYAVARWVYLRRFSPFNYTNSKAPICMQNDDASISFSSPETSIGRYVIHVQNTTNAPQLLKFSADYGIMVNWKEAIS